MSTSSTFNNASPIFNVDNSLSNLVEDLNLSSKQDDPLCFSPCYPFLSPWSTYDNEFDVLDAFLHPYHHYDQLDGSIEQVISSAITDDSSIFEADNNKKGSSKVEEGNTNNIKRPSGTSHGTKRRRTSNKDRHSKIRTAQGLRDRRMRLSLEVAHPFFMLQDMLGYDKASKTVEWLLVQSKEAIEEVTRSKKQTSPSGVTKCTISSISDCEVESTTIDQQKKENGSKKTKRLLSQSSKSASKSKNNRKPYRATKESRTEARARARERTKKRLIMTSRQVDKKDHDEQQVGKSPLFGHSSSFEMMEIHPGDSSSQSNYNGIYHSSTEIPVQVNGTLPGSWDSSFTTIFSNQPKW